MTTRRARFKPVLNQPARRAKPCVPDEQLGEDVNGVNVKQENDKDACVTSKASTGVTKVEAVSPKSKQSAADDVHKVNSENSKESSSNDCPVMDTTMENVTVKISLSQQKTEILSQELNVTTTIQEFKQSLSQESVSVKQSLSQTIAQGDTISVEVPKEIETANSSQEPKPTASLRVTRGRRIKPAVNLPAALRKRPEPKIDTVKPVEHLEEPPLPYVTSPPRSSIKSPVAVNPLAVTETSASRVPTASERQPDAPSDAPVVCVSSPPPRPSTPVSILSDETSQPETQPPNENTSIKTDAAKASKEDKTAPNARQRRTTNNTNQRAWAARRNFMKVAKDGPPARSSLTMFDLIFYNPATNPMTSKSPPAAKSRHRQSSICSVSSTNEQRLEEEKVDDIDDHQMKESEDKENKEEKDDEPEVPVPRVKVGPDGRIIIDEQSLVIETTETKKTREEMEKSEVVFDTGLSNGFYKRTKRSKEWSNRETLKFYRALQVYGTDFSLMQVLFKDRNRKELKQKFKKEERTRGHLIDKALCSPLDFDTTELEKEAQAEEEEEAARLAKEKENKEAVALQPKPKKPTRTKPCSLALKEMSSQTDESCSESPPPVQKKKVRKPRAKPSKVDPPKGQLGLDIFDDVVLPGDVVPSASNAAKKPGKRKANPRDPAKPAKKRKKKESVPVSPESDHSYAAKETPPLVRSTPVSNTTPNTKNSTPVNYNMEMQSPAFVTVNLSSPLIVSPVPTRTIAVSPNEFTCPQYATIKTPRTPVSINISPHAGLATEFGSPNGPSPNKAVPVAISMHSPTSGAIVPVHQTPTRVAPGSLYVLQTQCPDDPKRHVLGVYMVTDQPKVSDSPMNEPQLLVPEEPLSEIVRDPVEGTILTKL